MEKISIDLQNTDLKTVIIRKTHNEDETIPVFTLHKEYNQLNKDEKLQIMKGLLDYVVTELGRINQK